MIKAIINTTARAYLRPALANTVAHHTALHLPTRTAHRAHTLPTRLSANWHINPATGAKTCVWSDDADTDTDNAYLSIALPVRTLPVNLRFLQAA